jgi:UPF0755 protein
VSTLKKIPARKAIPKKPVPHKGGKGDKKPVFFNFKFSKETKFIIVLAGIFLTFIFYRTFLASNVIIQPQKYWVYIPPNSNSAKVAELLADKEVIGSAASFRIIAGLMSLDASLRPGLFRVEKDWTNYELIDHLKNDSVKPSSKVRLHVFRNRRHAVNLLCSKLNLNKEEFYKTLKDSAFIAQYAPEGFSAQSIYCMFLPGSYYFHDSTNILETMERMHEEYLQFWNKERREIAEEIGLNPLKVMILSSIVYSETKNYKEMPVIAGVYINRLKKNMRLESDPTLIFANNKGHIRRLYDRHKTVKSKYNTYKYKGLPPGPICIPPLKVIDAILFYYDPHNYIYFCAKEDSSGCHTFAASYDEHKINAENYRQSLNKRKIY